MDTAEKEQTTPQGTDTSFPQENTESKGIWFFAEHRDGKLEDDSLKLAGESKILADRLKEEVSAIVIGHQIKDFSTSFGPYGTDKILIVEDERLGKYTGDAYVDVLAQLVKLNKPSIILFAASPMGNDLASRLAARIKVGLVSHYVELNVDGSGKLIARRPVYSGRGHATVTPLKKPLVATVDTQTLALQKAKVAKNTQVIKPNLKVDVNNTKTKLIDYLKADPCAVCVSEAEIVIGVGKGLSCADNLKAVEELARVLGASIGGSRRATDERWIADERRIGLTGKNIAPKLYLICGISGAFHHTLSIKESKLMVVINTDRNAPITKIADLVIVGDMQQIIPELTKQLREMVKPNP